MNLKLIYFKMRALAEAPQLLLHYTNIKYEYYMSWEYYKKIGMKLNLKFLLSNTCINN